MKPVNFCPVPKVVEHNWRNTVGLLWVKNIGTSYVIVKSFFKYLNSIYIYIYIYILLLFIIFWGKISMFDDFADNNKTGQILSSN